MLNVSVDGVKKKLACGPCIRGHRSSKCAHRDRILIEVRKPGRPLSACPHPAGSCKCQRNFAYGIPKTSECPNSTTSGELVAFAIAEIDMEEFDMVHKPKGTKSLSSIAPSVAPKAIHQRSSNLLSSSEAHLENVASASSGNSSTAPSLPSSSSSTPQIAAVDMSGNHDDLLSQVIAHEIKHEAGHPQYRLGMLAPSGFATPNSGIGLMNEFSGYQHTGQASLLAQNVRSASPRSSCCAPKSQAPFDIHSDAHQGNHRAHQQGAHRMPSNILNDFPVSDFSTPLGFLANVNDSFALPVAQFNALDPGHPADIFSQLEDRPGCRSHVFIPGHVEGGGNDLNCQCGDNCLCLGCLDHPANRTTTSYVQWHVDQQLNEHFPFAESTTQSAYERARSAALQSTHVDSRFHPLYNPAPSFSLSHNENQPWPMGDPMAGITPTNELNHVHLHTSNPTIPSIPSTNANFGFHTGFQDGFPQAYRQEGFPRQQGPSSSTSRQVIPNSLSSFTLLGRDHYDQDGAFDHDSPSTEGDNASTLSPSSILLQQFRAPGCSDETGTCLCGDGCPCPDCLTHRGHGD